jgi:hypothetical protein
VALNPRINLTPLITDQYKALAKHHLSTVDLVNLCGGIPSAGVSDLKMEVSTTSEETVHVKIFTDLYEVVRSIDFELGIIENSFMLVYKPGQSVGTNLFLNQVREARSRKLVKLRTFARATEEYDDLEWLGYYCWGRLGYKMRYDEQPKFRDWLHSFGRSETTLSDLLATKEGCELWRKHGYGWLGEFYLADNTETMNNLRNYLRVKGIQFNL